MVLDQGFSLEISITKQKCSKGNNELTPPPTYIQQVGKPGCRISDWYLF